MRLYLIRHGETEHNRRQLLQGHAEIPLNDAGIQQASLLGERMRDLPLDHIYASDLRRTTMTAAILAAHTGVSLSYDMAYRERDPGELADKSYEEGMAFFTDPLFEPPGGESVPTFATRVEAAFNSLIESEGDRGRNVAVVSHGMVCAAFMNICIGMPIEQIAATTWPNTCLTIADYNGSWSLVEQGDASHLEGTEHLAGHNTGA